MSSSFTLPKEKTIMGHPVGLGYLFFTEMWERFSYYGMRSLLVYYMINHLKFSQPYSSSVYGFYTGFVYFTPMIGGYLADRFIGQRKAVIIGGILMAIGHFLMAFESMFFPALVFLILGCGAFKPNISTQVGGLYHAGDHRRDRAFGIFYMGINLGAFFSPLVCGTLGEKVGYHYGFAAAGVGMIIGLIIYLIGQKHLAPDNIMKQKIGEGDNVKQPMSGSEKNRIGALLLLCACCILFWAVYEQQGNVMALWVKDYTNRIIFNWEMPASWFQSFNPAMIFILTPILTAFWAMQAKKNTEPPSVVKLAIGCTLLGLSFLILIPATFAFQKFGPVSLLWVAASTLLLTIGEIYLSPVGLSLVTKVAPLRMVSLMMGTWFIANFAGNYLCGYLGTFWEKMPKQMFFLILSALALFAGLCIFMIIKPLKKAISHGLDGVVDI